MQRDYTCTFVCTCAHVEFILPWLSFHNAWAHNTTHPSFFGTRLCGELIMFSVAVVKEMHVFLSISLFTTSLFAHALINLLSLSFYHIASTLLLPVFIQNTHLIFVLMW